jgi:hypothetical protein
VGAGGGQEESERCNYTVFPHVRYCIIVSVHLFAVGETLRSLLATQDYFKQILAIILSKSY